MEEKEAITNYAEEVISTEVLIKCLRKIAGREMVEITEDVEVSQVTTTRATAFTSTLWRVKVFFKVEGKTVLQNKSLMVKKMPTSEIRSRMVGDGGFFSREVFFLGKALPFMKTLGGRRNIPPVPECYIAECDDLECLIVSEDLSQSGYRTFDRSRLFDGMDMEHCKMAMRKLGELHGFSYASERSMTKRSGGWLGMEPGMNDDLVFSETEEAKNPSNVYGMFLESVTTALELAEEVNQIAAEAAVSGELASKLDSAWSIVCQLVRPVSNGPNVLSHGDCWTNTIMFRYGKTGNGEKLVDAKFLDFQICRYGHPCIDIIYFLYMSTRRSFRKKYTNELLLIYYNSVVETMASLGKGSPPITLGELRHELHFKYKPFGIIIASIMKPILMLDPKIISGSVEEYEERGSKGNYASVKECYDNVPAYKDNLIEVLEELYELILQR